VARLARSIQSTLEREIERSRGEVPAYFQDGEGGDFQVYGRSGECCPRCRARILRFVQEGRSTYYCPQCQPENVE
jgi:formamidopyrimidine-DNA glycosylase